ncbi:MAG: CinA family nicotinamide mononucleotide deamidase-related protein [Chitinophagaceae bacterium]|nr:CinA family nicotinamide mononucleotide deamidase-related protein [Chitinophagaceae bacterium]
MPEKVNASIITIGDELLIGQVVDTNSSWMAMELNKYGIWLKRRVAVGDSRQEIIRALEEESRQADIILLTGGLGPTSDDITKRVLNEYFGGRMVTDQAALDNVKAIFARFNRPLLESNVKQAEVPNVCTVVYNTRGTAPGMWFEKDNKIYVSMPGVPHEMKGMMLDFVLPKLVSYFVLPAIISRTLLTAGIGESFLADHIKEFEQALPSQLKLAYLPNYGMVRLRLTVISTDTATAERDVEEQFAILKERVKEYLVTDRDEALPAVVGRLLTARGETVSTAESCTGGYIAHLLTAHAGASDFFKGGVVSYANEIKQEVLHVSDTTIRDHGAVSEETVRAMVQGCLNLMNTSYSIAVSGIMGPGGGSLDKPVGTVWIAVGNDEGIIAEKLHLRFDRTRNIEFTAIFALNLLRKLIVDNR